MKALSKSIYNLSEGFNLLLNFSNASNNFNAIFLLILQSRSYYGTFPAGYIATLGPLSLPKNNYLGRFGSHPESSQADFLTLEGLTAIL